MQRECHPRIGAPHHRSHEFTILFRDYFGRSLRLVTVATDANDATMAFHDELRRLEAGYARGELMIVKNDNLYSPVLRHRLESRRIHDLGAPGKD